MKPQIDKPKYGEKCNKCGLCCLVEPCPVSAVLFNQPQCPALEQHDKTLQCGLMIDPRKYITTMSPDESGWVSQLFNALIGGNTYCDHVANQVDFFRSNSLGPKLRARTAGDLERAIQVCLMRGMPVSVETAFRQLVHQIAQHID